MQFVPAIAPDVEQLTIFQRSRHWVTPNPNYHRAVTDAEKWLFHHVPYYEGWYRFLNFWNSADRMYPAFRVDPDWPEPDRAVSRPNDKLRRVMTTHIERELGGRGPSWSTRSCPTTRRWASACCRTTAGTGPCCATTSRSSNERIAGVEPDAVVTTSGRSYPVDVIVLATGFHPNKYLWPMQITGRGVVLEDLWGEDPRAYLGITMPGFPNLFCLYGPNTNPVVGSVIVILECQVHYIVQCIGALLEDGYASMECRQDVHDDYNERVDAEHEHLVWRHPQRAQLLQQQQGPRHHEHALDAARLLADDEGTRARRLRPDEEAGVSGRLDGQVGIVTGAASGFGRATANRFAEEGARVVIVDLDEPRGAVVVDEVRAAGTDARLVVGDVSTLEVAQEAVTTATGEFGRLDVLVNNAGIVQGDDRDTWDTTEETWDRLLPREPAQRVRVLEGRHPGDPRRREAARS